MNPEFTHFRSPKTLSTLAIAGITGYTIFHILAAILGIAGILNPGTAIALDPNTPASAWVVVLGLVFMLQFPVYVFAVVTFLMWLFRVFKNLPALRSENSQFTPGWAVGWWFIPLANLIKPFQAVRNAWSESDPDIDTEMGFLSHIQPGAPFFMTAWWAFWIIANVFTNISSRLYDPGDRQSLEIGNYGLTISGVFWSIAAGFAIKVLLEITQRQEQRFNNVGVLNHQKPPPPPTFGEPVAGNERLPSSSARYVVDPVGSLPEKIE